MGRLSQAWDRLVVSGGAERRRRTTRRCIGKVIEDVVVRRTCGNLRCISIQLFMNVSSRKNIPQG